MNETVAKLAKKLRLELVDCQMRNFGCHWLRRVPLAPPV